MPPLFSRRRWIALALGVACLAGAASAAEPRSLNVLFIGNSFTGRHNLSQVVKAMAEAGNPGLKFEVRTVIYGGRTLKDLWRLGTQNFVRLAALTPDEERATLAALKEAVAKNPNDTYAKTAVQRHEQLLKQLATPHRKWDIVVLQSYHDDEAGEASSYVEYAPKFAALIRAQGGEVVLYETTPATQNAQPLTAAPDPEPVRAKERVIAALARRLGAKVVPMASVALRCQTDRPDIALRFVNDAHLNQTMAYLTACTFYATLFGRSPEGLPVDSVTDIRFLDNRHKNKDRDGNPVTKTFNATERAALQRIAWQGVQDFNAIAASVAAAR
jgi:hypothetical protein